MIFETFAAGGCRSYLVGCEASRAAVVIDPELSLIDRYLAAATLRELGFNRAAALDGGMKRWREGGLPLEQ